MIDRIGMAQQIVDWEARRDSAGRLLAYRLPGNDGGGAYEVAGINQRYHPEKARELADLIARGEHAEAERRAVGYIAGYTDGVAAWQAVPAVELFLRDCAFNRGPGGAARIAQMAAGVAVDGQVGPVTRKALAAIGNRPYALLARLRGARERYEDKVAPGRPNLRAGLESRWDKSTEAACRLV